MCNSIIILGNGFDMDLGINLSFSEYRNSSYCLAHDLNKLNPKGNKWNDFERELRSEIISISCNKNPTKKAKDIYEYWQSFCRYFSAFITECTENYPDEKSLNENCAFILLKNLQKNSKVFTFNYTFPYEYTTLNAPCDFKFVHGRYYKDTFNKRGIIISQSQNLIIGVDHDRIPHEIRDNKYIHPIIKKNNHNFVKSGIEDAISDAENVIIFGHGLGITDADYFDNFFSKIKTNGNICRSIYTALSFKNCWIFQTRWHTLSLFTPHCDVFQCRINKPK